MSKSQKKGSLTKRISKATEMIRKLAMEAGLDVVGIQTREDPDDHHGCILFDVTVKDVTPRTPKMADELEKRLQQHFNTEQTAIWLDRGNRTGWFSMPIPSERL